MIDSWIWVPADADNVTSDTVDKVNAALDQGASVYCIGNPNTAGVIAVIALDPAGDRFPTVLSDEREATALALVLDQ